MSEALEWVLSALVVVLFLVFFWFPMTGWARDGRWVWRWWR